MGYLFLTIALLCGSLKGFCGKKISGEVSTLKGVFYINFLRMILCILIGFVIVLFGGLSGLKINSQILVISMVSGVSTALFVASWIFCVRKGAYVMVDIFLMLGSVIPIVLCNIFFGEKISMYQCIGVFLLLISSCIMCSYSSNVKGSFTVKSLGLLLLCGICSGVTEFSQKWFSKGIENGNVAAFNLYAYLFAALTLLIFFMINNKIEQAENDGKSKKIFFVVCVMAVCLFANSFFRTMAAKYIDAAVLYPLSNSLALILSAIMAAVFFGEKITIKCILGILVTFAAIVVMNFK